MPKTRMDWFRLICRTILVVFGTVLVSFGTTAFHVPLDINSGGLSGVGIVVRYFAPDAMKVISYNLVVTGASILLWVVGLIFIGKDFALKTLVATIVFPAATWLFTTCPGISDFVGNLGELMKTSGNGPTAGNYLLSSMFGGVFVGIGVAITFVGGGSTGGVDVLTFLMEKFLRIKQSIASFIIDGSIVIIGLIVLVSQNPEFLLPCLSGIVSAFVTAVFIEFIYIGSGTCYQVDVISTKWEEISRFAQDNLGRGTTVIRAEGGYHGDERVILRIVFEKRQYNKLRNYISKVDPKAFVTFTQTNAVFGEGFKDHQSEAIALKKKNKNDKQK